MLRLRFHRLARDERAAIRTSRRQWPLMMLGAVLACAITATALASGADLVICRIGGTNTTSGFLNLGAVGSIRAFAADSVTCNFGDAPCGWDDDPPEPDNNHPVISQTIYRLRNGRFIQLGQSWAKHGGNATNQPECGLTCQPSGTNSILGIGCCDAYNALTNGTQFVGPKADVNPASGFFNYPFCSPADGTIACPPADATIGRRLQVNDADIDTAAGVQYFFQIHLIVPDDVAATPRTDHNNASYRPFSFNASHNIQAWTGVTIDSQPAIAAWRRNGLGPGVIDPDVKEFMVEVANDGRFYFAGKASNLGNGQWHYEYAVQNYNSDRAGQSFSVPLPPGTTTSNVLFHDVPWHSGEPYSNLDWVSTVTGSAITWSSETFAQNVNANALRWDTLFNFRFDANKPPKMALVTLGLFKPPGPGDPIAITALLPVPDPDCNNNQVADATDIANGTSQDVNLDGVPDECQSICVGDIVSDGTVNVSDLLAVISAWGPCPAPPATCPADIDPPGGNGAVNVGDLLSVISHWGACP